MSTDRPLAHGAGELRIGDLTVHRLGFGAMQLTGPGVWGEPRDPDEAVRVLRRAVDLGIDFIDTADSYGPHVSERLIRTALHPYPDGLLVATKAGLLRPGPNQWRPDGRPEHLRRQCELSLERLGLEQIPLFQLHRIDPGVPLDDQLGELVRLQQEGKIRHIGLSEVTVDQLDAARRIATIVSVQNLFNLYTGTAEPLLAHAESHGIAFIPWCPLATGALAGEQSPLARLARARGATPAQLALAWLLHRSPAMLPIPGTSSVAHLEQNTAAAAIELSPDEMVLLHDAVGGSRVDRGKRALGRLIRRDR